MTHAQKPDLVFLSNGRVHLNRRGSQFCRLLAVEECGPAGRPWIDHVPRHSARVVATLSNRLFPLHFPSHASPCTITFRTASTVCFFYTTLPHQYASVVSFRIYPLNLLRILSDVLLYPPLHLLPLFFY